MVFSAFGQTSRNHNAYTGQPSMASATPAFGALQAPTALVCVAMPSSATFSSAYSPQSSLVGGFGSSCPVQKPACASPSYARSQPSVAQPNMISSGSYFARTPAPIVGGNLGFEPRAARVIGGGIIGDSCNVHSSRANPAQLKDAVAGGTDTSVMLQQDAVEAPPALVMLQQNIVEAPQDQACYYITVTTLTGETTKFQCQPLDTVDMLKETIYQSMGHLPSIQKLILYEKPLADGDSTLKDLDVADGSVLTLVLDVNQAAAAHEIFHETTMLHNLIFEMRRQLLQKGDGKLVGEGERLNEKLIKASEWLYTGEVTVEEIRRRMNELGAAIHNETAS